MERNSFRTAAIFEATSWGCSGSAGLSDRNHSRRFTMLSVLFQAEFGLAAEFCSRHNGCACCTSPQVQIKATNPWHKFFLISFCIRAGRTFSTVTRKCISTAHDGVETWWLHTKSSFSSGGCAFFICSNFSATWRPVHIMGRNMGRNMGRSMGCMESNIGVVPAWAARRLSLHYRFIRGQAGRHKFHGRKEVLCNCNFSVPVFPVKFCLDWLEIVWRLDAECCSSI